MSVFVMDGFETYGDKTTAGATVESNISATDGADVDVTFVQISGGHAGGNVSIIDDFATEGFALEFPDFQAARSEFVRYEWPDGTGRFADKQVSTNASAPVFCVGFRLFNADWTVGAGTVVSTIFNALNSSSGTAFSVSIQNDKTTLRLTDNDGTNHDAASALVAGQWHYIEVEWKQTTDANGGYGKVYVDGSEVIDTGTVDMSGFTFFSTFGFRVGIGSSGGNQTGGSNYAIDDVYGMEIDGVEHTAPLGVSRVRVLHPTSDATPNDWTRSTGADNYALIDEQDWDTSDYVDGATTGDDDHYGLTTLSSGATVHGVQIDCVCIATDGTPTLHLGFDDGTADEQSQGVIGTGSTVMKRQFFEEDPSNAAWTDTSINAVEATQRMTE